MFFTVSPETRGFRTRADAQLKREIAGMKVDIPVRADTKDAIASVEGLRAKMQAIAGKLTNLRIGATTADAEAPIIKLQARLAALAKQASSIMMSADPKKLDAQITAKLAQIAGLNQKMSALQMDANSARLALKIATLESQIAHFNKQLNSGKADINVSLIRAKLAVAESDLAVLNSRAQDIKLSANAVTFLRQVAVAKNELAGLRAQARDLQLGGNIDPAKLLSFEAGLLGIEAAMEKLAPVVAAGDTALGAFGRTITGGGRGWGILLGNVRLFGGVLGRVLPVALASVAVWHILADAIIEVGAVWIPATLAVGAFAVAASDAAKEIQQRMQAAHTEMDATGRSIPQLASGMEALHRAVRPQVYQIFGDALAIMKSRTGEFATVAKGTGTVLDQLAARITFAITSNKQFGSFMSHAVTDVSKLGDSIGNIFGIFGNFFKVIPGFATGLLTIGDDFTKILEKASAAAEPILRVGLLLHGWILYTGLAVTASLAFVGAMANLIRAFITFGAGLVLTGAGALADLAALIGGAIVSVVALGIEMVQTAGEAGVLAGAMVAVDAATGAFADTALAAALANPFFWVAGAVVLLGGLFFMMGRSKDAAQTFNDSMQKTITSAQIGSLATTIQAAQAATSVKLASATTDLNKALAVQGPAVTGAATRWSSNYSPAVDHAARSVLELTAGQKQIADQAALVNGRVGALSKQYGSNTAALGALSAAGITSAQITDTNKDKWAQALIQVSSTTNAYAAMGTQAGVLGNDLDVLGRTLTDQYKAVQALNQGWSAFIADVTGTQGSFDTVAQGFATLNDHAGTLRFSLGKLHISYKDNAAAIDSLTPAGIALNQAFGTQVQNVDKLFASWRTAGLAGNLFTQGVKAAIAPLTKYANGSQEATAQLVALAQEAGYQGPISMQALSKWLGNTHGATQKLKDITNQATIQEALLTGAMQNQGNFISSKLLGDINQAILSYSGVEKAVSAYGTAVAQSGKSSDAAHAKMVTAIGAIVKAEVSMGDNTSQMAAIVAKTFGISMPAALALVKTAMGDLAGTTLPYTQKAFLTFAETGLNKTKGQAHDLWNEIIARLGPRLNDLGNLAGGPAKKKFIDWAMNGLHLSKTKATELWQEVDTLQNHINNLHGKDVKVGVNFVGSGTGSIAFKESIPGVTTGPSSQGLLGFHAAGGMISGGQPGKDSVLGMLMPGEVVVPTAMVKQGAVDHLRGMLPGFAAGGSVGAVMSHGSNMLSAGSPFMEKAEAHFGRAVEAAFAKAVIAKFKKDMNSLGGSGSAIVSYARSFLGKIPYVFGGNSLSGGIDCSGFTQAVYSKFGIHAPRTSEAQYAWATKSGPVPGSLAFYVSPAGGPPPGHVAIVQNGNSVISQGGGMGPAIESLHFLPLMGTGVPKGGFPSSAGGGGNAAIGGGSLQAIAMALLRQYGWANQWPSFNALENSEAGWRMNARNPGSGAYGLAQFIHGPSEYFQYGGNPSTALGQLTAMMNYIAQRYPSGPNEAWAFHQRNNYYGKGGTVPAMAAGGTVGGLRARLASQEGSERAKYFGLVHSFAAGPAKFRTRTVMGELATLAARQRTEQDAYAALAGTGLTSPRLHHLGATARSEIRTASDKGLTKMPGGHPGFAADLRKYLGQISATASGTVPAGSKTGGTPATPASKPGGGPGLSAAQTAAQGSAWLKAWQTRHGGGYGAAWGPVVVNQQIDAMAAAQHRAALLSRAPGLTAGQHRFWGSAAADEGRRLGVLRRELTVERSWRGQLGASDIALTADIRAAGSIPSLAKNVRAWQAQITRQKSVIAGISKMLGYSDAQIAAMVKAGKLGPGGTPLPKVTHTYGGDVADNLGAFLHSVIAPFARGGMAGGFARGGMTSFDNGGMLQPGATLAWNGTGRPEPVGAQAIQVEVQLSWAPDAPAEVVRMLRKHVRTTGGNVQRALGQQGTVSGSANWKTG